MLLSLASWHRLELINLDTNRCHLLNTSDLGTEGKYYTDTKYAHYPIVIHQISSMLSQETLSRSLPQRISSNRNICINLSL